MEAVRLLGSLRSPIHAIIDLSDKLLLNEFGTLSQEYQTHAKQIRANARRILEAVDQAVCAGGIYEDRLLRGNDEILDLLNTILSSASTIRYGMIGLIQDQHQDCAILIQGNAEALLDDLHSISQLTNPDARRNVKQELIDVEQLIQKTFHSIEPYALLYNVNIGLSLGAGAMLLCDPIRIRRILLYIIRNAVNYGGAGRTITIKTEVTNEAFGIIVSDTGHGILVHGMALTLVKIFVQEQGGELKVVWMPDQGNVVRLGFPLDRVKLKQDQRSFRPAMPSLPAGY